MRGKRRKSGQSMELTMLETQVLPGRILRRLALGLTISLFITTHARADALSPPLGRYNAELRESSISRTSSGAFMSVQFATAWSSVIKGVGAIAGGPYYCAQGSALASA